MVEQRREPRLETNAPLKLTVLGLWGGPSMVGQALDMSGSGLRVRVPLPLPCGAPVKVETEDLLLLGEVSRCVPVQEGYEAGLTVAHILSELAELRRLNRALLSEYSVERSEVPTRS